jgi:hypothetical protein
MLGPFDDSPRPFQVRFQGLIAGGNRMYIEVEPHRAKIEHLDLHAGCSRTFAVGFRERAAQARAAWVRQDDQ